MGIHYLPGNHYNILLGYHPKAQQLMAALDIAPSFIRRFRDCFPQRRPDGVLELHVLTRIGGGNRVQHEDVSVALRRHPLYLDDYDEPYDTTYATFIFACPSAIAENLQRESEADPSMVPKPWLVRLHEFDELSGAQPDHPEVRRVLEAMQPLLGAINSSSERVHGLLDADTLPW
jgi:hypothetical protein